MRFSMSGSARPGRRVRLRSSHGSRLGLRVSHRSSASRWTPPSKDAEIDADERRRAAGSRGKKKRRKGRKR